MVLRFSLSLGRLERLLGLRDDDALEVRVIVAVDQLGIVLSLLTSTPFYTFYPSTFHNGESAKSSLLPSRRVLNRADVAALFSTRLLGSSVDFADSPLWSVVEETALRTSPLC